MKDINKIFRHSDKRQTDAMDSSGSGDLPPAAQEAECIESSEPEDDVPEDAEEDVRQWTTFVRESIEPEEQNKIIDQAQAQESYHSLEDEFAEYYDEGQDGEGGEVDREGGDYVSQEQEQMLDGQFAMPAAFGEHYDDEIPREDRRDIDVDMEIEEVLSSQEVLSSEEAERSSNWTEGQELLHPLHTAAEPNLVQDDSARSAVSGPSEERSEGKRGDSEEKEDDSDDDDAEPNVVQILDDRVIWPQSYLDLFTANDVSPPDVIVQLAQPEFARRYQHEDSAIGSDAGTTNNLVESSEPVSDAGSEKADDVVMHAPLRKSFSSIEKPEEGGDGEYIDLDSSPVRSPDRSPIASSDDEIFHLPKRLKRKAGKSAATSSDAPISSVTGRLLQRKGVSKKDSMEDESPDASQEASFDGSTPSPFMESPSMERQVSDSSASSGSVEVVEFLDIDCPGCLEMKWGHTYKIGCAFYDLDHPASAGYGKRYKPDIYAEVIRRADGVQSELSKDSSKYEEDFEAGVKDGAYSRPQTPDLRPKRSPEKVKKDELVKKAKSSPGSFKQSPEPGRDSRIFAGLSSSPDSSVKPFKPTPETMCPACRGRHVAHTCRKNKKWQQYKKELSKKNATPSPTPPSSAADDSMQASASADRKRDLPKASTQPSASASAKRPSPDRVEEVIDLEADMSSFVRRKSKSSDRDDGIDPFGEEANAASKISSDPSYLTSRSRSSSISDDKAKEEVPRKKRRRRSTSSLDSGAAAASSSTAGAGVRVCPACQGSCAKHTWAAPGCKLVTEKRQQFGSMNNAFQGVPPPVSSGSSAPPNRLTQQSNAFGSQKFNSGMSLGQHPTDKPHRQDFNRSAFQPTPQQPIQRQASFASATSQSSFGVRRESEKRS